MPTEKELSLDEVRDRLAERMGWKRDNKTEPQIWSNADGWRYGNPIGTDIDAAAAAMSGDWVLFELSEDQYILPPSGHFWTARARKYDIRPDKPIEYEQVNVLDSPTEIEARFRLALKCWEAQEGTTHAG